MCIQPLSVNLTKAAGTPTPHIEAIEFCHCLYLLVLGGFSARLFELDFLSLPKTDLDRGSPAEDFYLHFEQGFRLVNPFDLSSECSEGACLDPDGIS